MEGSDFKPGLEGVVAFETEIAEPDKEGNALRYRGVDIEELVGHVPYEKVWGLLVDDNFEPGMPRAENVDLPAGTGSRLRRPRLEGDTAAERFLLRWRGEADPRHVRAIDSYWVSAAEHGAN